MAELLRSSPVRLVELEIWSAEEVLLECLHEGHKPGLPGWDVLRFVGGEVAEVYLQSAHAEVTANEPLLVSGRFLNAMLFQATYLPNQAEGRWRLSLVMTTARPWLTDTSFRT